MANIYDLAEQYRRELIAGEAARAKDITKRYGAAYERIQARLKALSGIIELRGDENVSLGFASKSDTWLQSENRYRELLRQIEAETARLAPAATSTIQSGANEATGLAGAGAVALLKEIDGTYNRLPVQATEYISGFLADGTPLSDLLIAVNKEGADKAKQALTNGILIGENPRQTANNIREALGTSLTRALKISRTETMRAYRSASIANYKESKVVTGWEWIATKSSRSCPSCLAMDGRRFELSTPFGSHPNCRCTSLPFYVGAPKRETGAQWLAKQDAATQDEVLGKAGGESYRKGEVPLHAFVHETSSEKWGVSRRTRGLAEAAKVAQEPYKMSLSQTTMEENLQSVANRLVLYYSVSGRQEPSPEQLTRAQNHLQKLLDAAQLSRYDSLERMEAIVGSGKFVAIANREEARVVQNRPEILGKDYAKSRAETEKALFGDGLLHRPIYAAVSSGNDGGAATYGGGQIRTVFKKEVRPFATITRNDSLIALTQYKPHFDPITAMAVAAPLQNVDIRFLGHLLAIHGPEAILASPDLDTLRANLGMNADDYFEAQLHMEVGVQYIERLEVDRGVTVSGIIKRWAEANKVRITTR